MLASYKKCVHPEANVLEIGASTVQRTDQLSKFCRTLVGIEVAPERIPADRGNVSYIVADWMNLSDHVPPDSVDVAVSCHVLEHIADDLKAVNELYRVLKPGGIGLINTPNRRRLVRAVIEFVTGPRQFPYWEHYREYTEEDLLDLLRKSRFEKYETSPIALGLLGGPVSVYIESVPRLLRKYANGWLVKVWK